MQVEKYAIEAHNQQLADEHRRQFNFIAQTIQITKIRN